MMKSLTAWKVFNLFLLFILLMAVVRAFKFNSYEPLYPLFFGWVGGDILRTIIKNLFLGEPASKDDQKNDSDL